MSIFAWFYLFLPNILSPIVGQFFKIYNNSFCLRSFVVSHVEENFYVINEFKKSSRIDHFQMVNGGYDQCKIRPLFLYYCLTKSLSNENFLFAVWLLHSQLRITIDGITSLNWFCSLRFATEFRLEILWECRDEIESFTLAERQVRFESWNF